MVRSSEQQELIWKSVVAIKIHSWTFTTLAKRTLPARVMLRHTCRLLDVRADLHGLSEHARVDLRLLRRPYIDAAHHRAAPTPLLWYPLAEAEV